MSIQDSLKHLQELSGKTQEEIAEELGIGRTYLSQLFNGRKPSVHLVRAILDLEKKYASTHIDLFAIPVLSWAQAGVAVAYEELPKEWQRQISIPVNCPDKKAFGIELRGDSMEPRFYEGDTVVVMPNVRPRTGCLVVARLKNDGVMFKRFFMDESGEKVELLSYNPLYPPMHYSIEDFSWIYPVFSVLKDLWH